MSAFEKDQEKKKNRWKLIAFFLALSLGIHLFLLLGLSYIPWSTSEKKKEQEVQIEIDPDLLKQIEQQKKLQVVESEKTNHFDPKKEAKYLSERNQTVEKETKAHNGINFSEQGGQAAKAGPAGKQSLGLHNLVPFSEVTPPTKEEGDEYRKQMAQQNSPQGNESGQRQSSTSDYLKDVKEGDRTLLNTKEFVFFSYYRRIRERLEIAWNGELQATMGQFMMAGRHLASERDYITNVVVVLDRHGRITNVQMVSGSGARDLDQAAVDAFNKAGPFPDPPDGLIESDGLIHIPWSFILQS